MDKAQVRRWVELLPQKDRNLPSLNIEGRWLSPNDILREVEAGTDTGIKALNFLSTNHLGTEEEMLVERIKQRLSTYPQDKRVIITLNKAFTPAEIMAEVEARTPAGIQFMETERRYLKYIDRLKERV